MGNFKGEIIDDENFTLSTYIQEHRLSKTRLYLISKRKSKIQCLLQNLKSISDSEGEYFDSDFPSAFLPPTSLNNSGSDKSDTQSSASPLPVSLLESGVDKSDPPYERTRREVNR